MAAYDASYGPSASAPRGLLSSLFDKVSGLFGREAPPVDAYAPAPPADYVLTPDAEGKVTLAGHKVPLALAVLGAGVVAVLLINRRTRAPAIAAATTAWSFFGSKLKA
jgi:hypothetical protein